MWPAPEATVPATRRDETENDEASMAAKISYGRRRRRRGDGWPGYEDVIGTFNDALKRSLKKDYIHNWLMETILWKGRAILKMAVSGSDSLTM